MEKGIAARASSSRKGVYNDAASGERAQEGEAGGKQANVGVEMPLLCSTRRAWAVLWLTWRATCDAPANQI